MLDVRRWVFAHPLPNELDNAVVWDPVKQNNVNYWLTGSRVMKYDIGTRSVLQVKSFYQVS